MTRPSEISDELKTFAYLSMRTGIRIPVLMDEDPIYIDAYLAVIADEEEANKKASKRKG